MPRTVKTPDGVVHQFPDDATDQEISDALNAPPSTGRTSPEGKARSWTDVAVDALPAAGGAIGALLGAATGIPTLGLTSGPGAIAGAGILGAGGEAARQLIHRARGQTAPATPMAAAGDIALAGGEQSALEAAGGAAVKGLKAGGEAVYRGYLKPSIAAATASKAGQVVQTALEEALPITKAGTARAQAVVNQLRGQVDRILQDTPGITDLHEIADKVRAFARARYFRPGAPTADFDAAMRVADSIDEHASLARADEAPSAVVNLADANQTKRALDDAVGENNFGAPNASATKKAQKVGRRAIRQDIEAQAPSVGPLNAREGRLIDAGKAVGRAVNREANKNQLFGVPTLISGLAGGEEYRRTGDPFQAAAFTLALRAGLHPAVASRAAILAYRLSKLPSAVPANVGRIAMQAVLEAQQQPEGVPENAAKQQQ